MKLAPVIARLKAAAPSLAGRVAGAAELAELLEGGTVLGLPHAFVIPFGDDSPGSNTAGAVLQQITEQIAVMVAVSPQDSRGQAGAEALDDIRAELWAALVGWEPAAEHAPIEYVGSEHVDLSRATLVHQYVFATELTILQS